MSEKAANERLHQFDQKQQTLIVTAFTERNDRGETVEEAILRVKNETREEYMDILRVSDPAFTNVKTGMAAE